MKLVIAYIQPQRLQAVKKELFLRQVYKISVSNAVGCGQQKGYTETYRGHDFRGKFASQDPARNRRQR